MQVGICKVKLHLADNRSLKEKRRVLKSMMSRIKNTYEVAIAEVDDNDLWQRATVGIVCTSNSHHQADEILSKVVDFIKWGRFDVEVIEVEREILSF